jgi:deazaflavin-dependent oxidoreductase (nitroreductase family)
MPIPKWVAGMNRFVTNPVARMVAGWAPGFAIVRHRGRKSGRAYSTPVNIFEIGGRERGFVIALTYGAEVDWLKNVMAAGGCTVRYRRREIDLADPVFIDLSEGMELMPALVRRILTLANVTDFVRLRRISGPSS